MNVQRFEELRIWQEARQLVRLVYTDFEIGTLGNRDFAFRNQLQKAGISVTNNIAEGFERNTDLDFAGFSTFRRVPRAKCVAWTMSHRI